VNRNWCFTINNPENNEIPEAWKEVARYCVWQREKGAEGTEHLQGYVSLLTNKRLVGMKKLNATAHWEMRKGTHEQAKAYCTKEDTRVAGPWEFGEAPVNQGKRNDLGEVKQLLDEGKTVMQVAETQFASVMRYQKNLCWYAANKTAKNRQWPTFTTVLWGEPGVGKTRRVMEEAGPDAYWMPKAMGGGTVFFDGYEGQEDVVIDEFYGWLPYDLLCRMLDRYPLLVDTKGSRTSFYPKRVWITSNKEPNLWYPKMPFEGSALQRRLTGELGVIIEVKAPKVIEIASSSAQAVNDNERIGNLSEVEAAAEIARLGRVAERDYLSEPQAQPVYDSDFEGEPIDVPDGVLDPRVLEVRISPKEKKKKADQRDYWGIL